MFRTFIPQFLIDKFENVEDIPQDELESVYIRNRHEAICTDVYTERKRYEASYYRCKGVLSRILLRHEGYILNVLAKKRWFDFKLLAKHEITKSNLRYHGNEFVFAASLIYFNGWFMRGEGTIEEEKEISFTLADYLIANKYDAAWLIRGLAQKYGLDVYCKPKLVEAETSFQKAKVAGVGTAILELANLNMHAPLEELTSKAIYEPTWEERSSFSRLE
jgi:hypothetical protein